MARLHAEATFWDIPEPPAAVAGAGASGQQPAGGQVPRGPEVQVAPSQESSADGQDIPALLETGAPAGESSVRLYFGTANLHQLRDQISFNKWIALMEKVTYNDNGLAEILVNFLFYAVALMQAYRSGASDDSREQKRMLEAWHELTSEFVAVLEAVARSGHPLWTLYREVSCRDDLLQKVASGALSATEKAEQVKAAFAAAALEQKKALAAEARKKEEAAAKTRAQPAQPAQSKGQRRAGSSVSPARSGVTLRVSVTLSSRRQLAAGAEGEATAATALEPLAGAVGAVMATTTLTRGSGSMVTHSGHISSEPGGGCECRSDASGSAEVRLEVAAVGFPPWPPQRWARWMV